MMLVAGGGVAAGWRTREIIPGLIAAAGVALGAWLGRQLGPRWLGLVVAFLMAMAFAAGVRLEWASAALLALIGTVAGLRWRDDPAPVLVLTAIASWAGVIWLLWPH